MKSIFLSIAILMLGARAIQAQPLCEAPEPVRAFYQEDAKQLAVRMMQMFQTYQDSIEIPDVLYKQAMRALLAVYNADQIPERDTVVECLALHTFPRVYMYGISVGLDANETWAQNLDNGIVPTGNAVVDGLLSHYNLSNSSSFTIGNLIFVSLTTPNALNPVALATQFDAIPGVEFAEQTGLFGDGSDITFQPTLIEDVELTYRAAWGDCPAGCTSSRNWKFRIKLDCGVQLLDVWGEELPQQFACNNNFECGTEPLCLDWLRDTVAFYQALFPECNQPAYGSVVTQMNNGSVIGLHHFVGADFDFVRFYTCQGEYLGQCLTTFAGGSCDDPVFNQYLESADTIWTCADPYPTAEECGVLGTGDAPTWASSMQVNPNPSSGYFQLSAVFDGQRKGVIRVVNVLGQMIFERPFQADVLNENIDLQENTPGLYFVQVLSGKEVASRKVVLRK
ncbi:MAG: T9SS type A sorting domain-containing protein [Saprospiraceae bacterium]|nr:T9SS type A sorting domain-containing protein [Saprospiraceae bacterium]